MFKNSHYPIWHPYTPQYPQHKPTLIQRAQGVYLFDLWIGKSSMQLVVGG